MYRNLSLPYAPINKYWSDMEEENCKISRRSLTCIEDHPPHIALEQLSEYLHDEGTPTIEFFCDLPKTKLHVYSAKIHNKAPGKTAAVSTPKIKYNDVVDYMLQLKPNNNE